jgi:uncharacterized membrane protein YeiB
METFALIAPEELPIIAVAVPTEEVQAACPQPACRQSRIDGFDVARAVAIVGMVIIHFTEAMSYETMPDRLGELVGLLDGRAAALFVILAGIGVTLMTRSAMASGDAQAIRPARWLCVRRGIFLLVLGFLNYAIWPVDILRVYGVSLFVAAALLTAKNRTLLFASALFVVAFIGILSTIEYSPHAGLDNRTYLDGWTPKNFLRDLFYSGSRSVFPWTGLLLFGMWLGRLDWRLPGKQRHVLVCAGILLVSAEVVSWWLVSLLTEEPVSLDSDTVVGLLGMHSKPPMPLFLLAAGSAAVLVISICTLAANRFQGSPVIRALAAMGRMALTWYLGHIVLTLLVVFVAAMLKEADVAALQLSDAQLVGVEFLLLGGFFAMAIAVSNLFAWFGWRGPAEWAMRRLAG